MNHHNPQVAAAMTSRTEIHPGYMSGFG